MRRVLLTFAFAAACGAATIAFAEDAPAPAPAGATPPAAGKKGVDDPNRIVCTREHVVGSNRPKKVCMTVAQREELRDRAQRTMAEDRRTPGGSEIVQQNSGSQ